ncbi:hypothetical protein A3I48_00485 [Candidatus Daviesbacteria bacterium RIFCSPLOWO2_02_FULL_36_7]|uniref:Uncharacterized protein n=1 Tax=Candidatus Daviesbacteria bacterium RIFCSPLOWO2_02_FULL_36_7 TaxID=1797792 RepID=A0A1F5MGF7_9BACT|nr:MAG: hypothetical protein A3I48_00485 [Candidatus Daviesbacteria bacterium RIFCSPLOWO2_02_FULL_36_7]
MIDEGGVSRQPSIRERLGAIPKFRDRGQPRGRERWHWPFGILTTLGMGAGAVLLSSEGAVGTLSGLVVGGIAGEIVEQITTSRPSK